MTHDPNIDADPLPHQPGEDTPPPPDLRTLGPRSNDLVTLRPWLPSDLPVIAEASRDPYLPLITTIPSSYTTEEGHAWLRRQHDQAAEGRGRPMAITTTENGDVVGMATINGINWTHRRAAVGYWILHRHRGQGFAKAALALLPDLARQLGLLRLEALVETDNHPSQAVCRALGFTEEGTLRSYYRFGDEQRDMIVFARLLPPTD
ncbi:MAG TPA: GNAT family protein [Amycolatopsis sp.]|nr:GNAT family protein [Amycolatopsis sp.]